MACPDKTEKHTLVQYHHRGATESWTAHKMRQAVESLWVCGLACDTRCDWSKWLGCGMGLPSGRVRAGGRLPAKKRRVHRTQPHSLGSKSSLDFLLSIREGKTLGTVLRYLMWTLYKLSGENVENRASFIHVDALQALNGPVVPLLLAS